MKKFHVFLSVLLLSASVGRAQQVYFTTDQLPDLIHALPAPPDSLSHGFAYDVLQYQWGKAQRTDSTRAETARRDAVWSYEALLGELSVPFGMTLSPERTPAIWTVLVNSLATTDQMRVAPKAFYHRRRPFEVFNEKLLSG